MTLDSPWWFILVALGCFRATRFFVYDGLCGANRESGSRFADALDRWAFIQEGPHEGEDRTWFRGKVAYLLACHWCLGFWICVAAAAAWAPDGEWWLWCWPLAGAQGLASSWERR